MVVIDGYGIAVLSFMGLVLTVGILTSLLVKKSSKRYMVAGKSLPLLFVGIPTFLKLPYIKNMKN